MFQRFFYPFILLIILMIDGSSVQAATSASMATEETTAPTVDEYVPAKFPGGYKGFEKWLRKSVRYPDQEREAGIEETIVVRFTVTSEGKVKYPYIEKGENDNLMEAALKAMDKMPKWTPAYRNGEPVDSDVSLDIEFYIEQKIGENPFNAIKRGR